MFFSEETSNRPLEHTTDHQLAVYEGNPSISFLGGYLGYVPGVCWNFKFSYNRKTCVKNNAKKNRVTFEKVIFLAVFTCNIGKTKKCIST